MHINTSNIIKIFLGFSGALHCSNLAVTSAPGTVGASQQVVPGQPQGPSSPARCPPEGPAAAKKNPAVLRYKEQQGRQQGGAPYFALKWGVGWSSGILGRAGPGGTPPRAIPPPVTLWLLVVRNSELRAFFFVCSRQGRKHAGSSC